MAQKWGETIVVLKYFSTVVRTYKISFELVWNFERVTTQNSLRKVRSKPKETTHKNEREPHSHLPPICHLQNQGKITMQEPIDHEYSDGPLEEAKVLQEHPDVYNNNDSDIRVAFDTERQSRLSTLEDRFEDIEGKFRSSCFARLCTGIWNFLQLLNTIMIWVLVVIVLYEFTRVNKLEQKLSAEQNQLDALQEVVKEKQEYQIKELNNEVEKQQTYTNYMLSGTFTLLTCLVSMFHMSTHLSKMNQPMIQRKILSILWMSPIYSVTSFLSLLYPPLEGPMKIIKDFYESYCIYQFLSFMILVLGRGTREQAVVNLAKSADHLTEPSRFLSRFYNPPPETSNHAKANAVITECQIFALQFVFIRPLTTIIYVFFVLGTNQSSSNDNSDNGSRFLSRFLDDSSSNVTDVFDPFSPTTSPTSPPDLADEESEMLEATKNFFTSLTFVLAMMVNISVFFAFLGLLRFYHAVREDLLWIRPWPKFLTIKGVVFLTFWQYLTILIIIHLKSKPSEDASVAVRKYQNILICLEMLFFSVTHWCVFPAEEWEKDYQPSQQMSAPGIGLQDFVSDVSHIVKNRHKRRKSRRRRGGSGTSQSPRYYKATQEAEEDELYLQENRPTLNGRRMYDFNDESFSRGRTLSDGFKADNDESASDTDNELI